jgi:hypothetical protein
MDKLEVARLLYLQSLLMCNAENGSEMFRSKRRTEIVFSRLSLLLLFPYRI